MADKQQSIDPHEFLNSDKVISHSESLEMSFNQGHYPYEKKMSNKEYEKTLEKLQIELIKVQKWTIESGQKITAIFEGRDAAGKGGMIKRYMEHLNPRSARIVALSKPSDVERGQWYFQRYVKQLPTNGNLAFFDRSWYNRTGVERVMGFCTEDQYKRFVHQVPRFEEMLVEGGLRLKKYWLTVSRHEQLRRFHARKHDPLKQWKLSPIDIASLDKWDDYTQAINAMFLSTNNDNTPWTVIRTDDKKRGRINCIRDYLSSLDYPNKDTKVVGKPDPKIVIDPLEIIDE